VTQDPFGNLRDWSQVLDRLDDLAASGGLDGCQPGLARILRYKGNWRLREAVLKHLEQIEAPSPDLVQEVMRLLGDDNLYYEARILAGQALVCLVQRGARNDSPSASAAADKLRQVRCVPQPPFFSQAIDRCLRQLA